MGSSGDILVLGWEDSTCSKVRLWISLSEFSLNFLSICLAFFRYTDMHADYSGQGFDQLFDVIHKIKNNPDDRRIILSAWNPSDLKLMALPPCHMFAQVCLEAACQLFP